MLGLAIVVVPLAALLPKVEWSTFAADITEPTTLAALALSARSAVFAVLACVVLGVPLALVIARARRGWVATLLRTIVTLPLVLPPLVGGVALLAVLGRTGILGPWLERAGVSIPFTPVAVIVAQTFVAMPFLVIAVEGALRSAGTDYEHVAAGLGASRWRIFTRVTLPLIAPGLVAGIVLAFARSVGEFGATALLAGNKPGVTQTIPMAIYTAFNGVGTSRQAGMALSVLLVATALAVLVIFPVARGSSAGVFVGRRAAEPSPEDLTATGPVDARPPRRGPAHCAATLTVDVSFVRPNFDLEAKVEVGPGRVLGLVGPNAAGKSTLLNLIAGYLTPAAGKIRMGDRVLSTPTLVQDPQRRRIGLLSQQPLLFPHLSVVENVAFGPRSQGVKAEVARERALELLGHVGLTHTAKRRPSELSGGQQQRVALARALATDPELLLLDEPLAALDVATAPHIRRILAAEVARTQVTAILVTHNLLDVVGLADEVSVIESGRVAETQPTRDFITRPTSAFGAALTGVNALTDPVTGALVHYGPDDLDLELVTDGAPERGEPDWTGTVDLLEAAGTRALVRVSVGDRFVTVPLDLARAVDVIPGQRVWVRVGRTDEPAVASARATARGY